MEDFNIVVEIPIQWGDMDAYNHVNNTVFFRFFEAARIAYLERIDFAESRRRGGIGAILHSTQCRFRRALQYPDNITVGARTISMSEDRFTQEYRIYSKEQKNIVADGSGIIVSFDYNEGQKAPLPRAVQDAITSIDNIAAT